MTVDHPRYLMSLDHYVECLNDNPDEISDPVMILRPDGTEVPGPTTADGWILASELDDIDSPSHVLMTKEYAQTVLIGYHGE